MQPIGPALAELLNPAIDRGESASAPPPDCSRRRIIPGTAAPGRSRGASGAGVDAQPARTWRSGPDATRPAAPAAPGFEEAPQANYGTTATIPRSTRNWRNNSASPPRKKTPRTGPAAAQQDGSARRRRHRRRAGSADPRRPPRIQGRRRPGPKSGRRIARRARKSPKVASASSSSPNTSRRATSPSRSPNWSRASRATTAPGAARRHRLGKTYTMAKVIEATQRPAIILAPNKTLAAQLYGEFKSFFPDNAVEYFVTYYDTTSPRPMCRAPTPISKRIPRSTSRSTACAIRRRGRCWSATTSSS